LKAFKSLKEVTFNLLNHNQLNILLHALEVKKEIKAINSSLLYFEMRRHLKSANDFQRCKYLVINQNRGELSSVIIDCFFGVGG